MAITPVEPRLHLLTNENEQDINPTQYKRLIRSLMYLSNTRSYLTYSVSIVTKFMGRLKESHLASVKRILRYVKCLIGCKILFSTMDKDRSCKLLSYTDSNWFGDKDDRKSIVGYIFVYEETPISWCSKMDQFWRSLLARLSILQDLCVCVKLYG